MAAESKSPSPDPAEAKEQTDTTPPPSQPDDDAEGEAEEDDSPSKSDEGADEEKESNEEAGSKSPGAEDQSDEAAKDSNNAEGAAPAQMEWQAVWSPPHNAYYFFNSRTGETTWVNPLQIPSDSAEGSSNPQSSTSATPNAGPSTAQQGSGANPTSNTATSKTIEPDASTLNGIDPELAYLDPTLYGSRPAALPGQMFSARFNARTGRFTAMDGRDPTHLSEAQRAQRMSEVYFDVGKWEQEVAARNAEEATGDKRKRPTKKEMERWRESKKQKKLAKTAWLRS